MRAALLGMAFALALAAQSFPVAGVMVDAVNGSPLKRARVTLSGPNVHEQALITGEDGRFAFNVPRGKYALNAERLGVRERFGEQPGTGFGIAVFTGPDQHTSNLVFRWVSPGAISGTVTDDRDEPAASVLVQLIRSSIALGRRRFAAAGFTRTNDIGGYRFGPLAAGTYYLVVTGTPWYSVRIQPPQLPSEPLAEAVNVPAPAYAPAYYPDASDFAGASPLTLAPGAEIKADFTLRTISGVDVRVHATPVTTQAARLSLVSDGPDGVYTFQRQTSLFGGSQTIVSVPPGRYTLDLISAGNPPLMARRTLDIGTADVAVEIQMQPAPTLSGKVVFEGSAARSGPVYVSFTREPGGQTGIRPVDDTGSFSFKGIAPGKYRVLLRSRDGFFISRITAAGASLQDGLLDVGEGASIQLNITASGETGRIKGFVMKAGEPVAGVIAVLAPRAESSNPRDYRGYMTDSDGSFDYTNVPAGDYVLFAVNRGDFEFANPTAVRPYLASGKAIHIYAHSVSDEQISLSTLVTR